MTPFTRALAGILPGGALAGPGPSAAAELFAGSRLTATGGVSQREGAAGGGIVPRALIGLFGPDRGVIRRQRLGLGSTVPGETIRQEIVGVKVKLAGDAGFRASNMSRPAA